MPKKIKIVNDFAIDYLQLGNRIINEVRQLTPYGAGNQKDDVYRTSNLVAQRTWAAQNAKATVPLQENPLKPLTTVHPQREAATAIAAGAGNCDQQGALAYCLLRKTLGPEFVVHLIVNTGSHHVYAAYEPVGFPEYRTVVDPWPTFGQAALAGDSYFGADDKFIAKSGYGKAGKVEDGASGLNKARYIPMVAHIDNELVNIENYRNTNQSAIDAAPWHQQFTTTERELVYSSSTGVEVRLPHARALVPPIPAPAAPPSGSGSGSGSVSGSVVINIGP
jgi:hypothetical protein